MVVPTGTAILILGTFVLPGFVTLVFRERLYVIRARETPFERLLLALFYSALIYGLLLVAAHALGLQKRDLVAFQHGAKPLGTDLAAAVAIFVALPAGIAIAGCYWRGSKRLRPRALRLLGSSTFHDAHSAWNVFFDGQRPCLVRATLRDGRIVGGLYDESSLAGFSERTQDLYLAERWEFDDDKWFTEPAERSLGIWIPEEIISTLELYELDESADNGKSHLRKTKG
jgi:hypothetical protein